MNCATNTALETLGFARRVANHAQALGVCDVEHCEYTAADHLGAVLAESVLQAGVNYRTVVRPRIDRIKNQFPRAWDLAGTTEVVDTCLVSDFLMWKHSEKIARFARLVELLRKQKIQNAHELKLWFRLPECRGELLQVQGVGPKTVDYLGCLLGIDCIAVDRHVRAFVNELGIDVREYDDLKLVVSYAADLLDIPRRNFDSWIWNFMSLRPAVARQYVFNVAGPSGQ